MVPYSVSLQREGWGRPPETQVFRKYMEISVFHSRNVDTDSYICILPWKTQMLRIYIIKEVDTFTFIFKNIKYKYVTVNMALARLVQQDELFASFQTYFSLIFLLFYGLPRRYFTVMVGSASLIPSSVSLICIQLPISYI